MKYVLALLSFLGVVNLHAQTQFLPQASKNPAWYVYEHALVICLGDGCYYNKQVNKYTLHYQTSTVDSIYKLREEIVSANFEPYNRTPRYIGQFTVKPSGEVYYMPEDSENYTIVDSNGLLIYDPAKQVGDTVDASWGLGPNGTTPDTIAKWPVLQVDTLNVAGTDRKRWVMAEEYDYFEYLAQLVGEFGLIPVDSTLHWIEGIGSNRGPFYYEFSYEPSFTIVVL